MVCMSTLMLSMTMTSCTNTKTVEKTETVTTDSTVVVDTIGPK